MALVLPVIIPLGSAIVALLALRARRLQGVIGVVGAVALLVAAVALLHRVQQHGVVAVQIGNWPAPYGITLVADLLAAIMVVLAALMGLAVAVYSLANVDQARQSFGYFPLLHVLLMGVCGAFLTGDLFNLYVWFEVMLMASFVLMILGGERPQLEGGIKYVSLNLIASALFLAGAGILYGKTGTLNMADLARKLTADPDAALINSTAMLFLAAFGIKAAVFPLFFWLPASYHTPPAAVSALFAGLLTKVGVYALLRSFTLFFVQDVAFTHTLILVLAGVTMITGVLGAAAQSEFRRILSFHIISQIGYMVMGLGLFTPLALAGTVFYLIHHIIVKTNLFLVSGWVRRLQGSYELGHAGGLLTRHPALALLFLIPALSLAGIPPLSGFFAKYALLKAGLQVEQFAIVVAALVASILTLFSMTKIWAEVFWKPVPADLPAAVRSAAAPGVSAGMWAPVAVLAGLTVIIGLAGAPIFALAERAAVQLLEPSIYIQAVLGRVAP